MGTFIIEKNNNYLTISNYHFKDKRLSLKAMGLLSLLLSLPDNWDYSRAGLAAICRDGDSSVTSALQELEKNGYLVRERDRGEQGKLKGAIYHIYQAPYNVPLEQIMNKRGNYRENEILDSQPINNHTNTTIDDTPEHCDNLASVPKQDNDSHFIRSEIAPKEGANTLFSNDHGTKVVKKGGGGDVEKKYEGNSQNLLTNSSPNSENPNQVFPNYDKPNQEKTPQRYNNTNIVRSNSLIYQSIYHENNDDGLNDRGERKTKEYEETFNKILSNINFESIQFRLESLTERLGDDKITLDAYNEKTLSMDVGLIKTIVQYMTDFIIGNSKRSVKIGDEYIPREIVKNKLLRIGEKEIKQTAYYLNTNKIKNPKTFAISMLYNA